MAITVKEQHRIGSKVNVAVLDKGGIVYARYVDATDWDADPDAVAAGLDQYLASMVAPAVQTAPVNKNSVVLDDAAVARKLAALDAAKLAAAAIKAVP